MNKKIIFVAIALAVAISAAAFVFQRKAHEAAPTTVTDSGATAPDGDATTSASPTAAPAVKSGEGDADSQPTGSPTSSGPSLPVAESNAVAVKSRWESVPLTPAEKKSVKVMSSLLAKYVDPKMGNPDLLVKEFAKAGMEPVVATQENPYTGKLVIVRCNNPPAGTRCCHAQYFEDEHKKLFLQHMSFGMRPNPEGMAVAEEAINAALAPLGKGRLGKPRDKTEDMASWEVKSNYTVTIKKLTSAEELKYDPFCAQDEKDDIGSFKIMLELVPGHTHD